LIWTITPALILIAIAFPSFRLLYLLDLLFGFINLFVNENILILSSVPIISINKNQPKRISDRSITKIHSNCKDIIPFGQLYPTIGIRLTRLSRNMTVIPLVSVEQIVGHLLGDGGLAISHTSVNSYFYLTQTFKRFEYNFFVFSSLSFLCEAYPNLQKSVSGREKEVKYMH
jgi:hypothetical protein